MWMVLEDTSIAALTMGNFKRNGSFWEKSIEIKSTCTRESFPIKNTDNEATISGQTIIRGK